MLEIIPGRIENGRIVPEKPLPDAANRSKVSILLEWQEPPTEEPIQGSTFSLLHGIAKGFEGDPKEEYYKYLEAKHK